MSTTKKAERFTILNEIDEHAKQKQHLEAAQVAAKMKLLKNEKTKTTAAPEFPLEVFPIEVQEVIKSYNRCTKYPTDYYGMSALVAASVVIGNSYAAEYKPHFWTSPLLYGMIVARSGIGKNRIINSMLQPLKNLQDKWFDEHEAQLRIWEQEKFEAENSNEEPPAEPHAKRVIIGDATMEKIYRLLKKNPRGILMLRQEVLSWIKDMNSYRKGSDGEKYLELWDNDVMSVERMNSTLYLRRPNLSVFGGIQPEVLKGLLGEGREANGFIPRILFAYPTNMEKKHPTEQIPDGFLVGKYNTIINRLNDLPTNVDAEQLAEHDGAIKSVHLRLDPPAQKRFFQFLCDNTDAQNAADEEIVRAILAKMDNYCLRFVCILYLYDFAAKQADIKYFNVSTMESQTIPIKFVEDAIKLVEYFKSTALKVVDKFQSPVSELPENKQNWYEALPDEFTFDTALTAWESIGLKKRSMQYMLMDRNLFEKLPGKGNYRKNFF